MRRNRNNWLILSLCGLLVIFITIHLVLNISIYVVYKASIGSFLISFAIIAAIFFVFMRGKR